MPKVKFKQINQDLTSLQNQANLTGSFSVTGSMNVSGSFFLNDTNILEQINTSGIFKQTGSYWSATSDLQVTGSFSLELDGVEDIFSVNVDGEEKFRVNEEGIIVLASFDIPPSPVAGGIMYSGSNEFFLGL